MDEKNGNSFVPVLWGQYRNRGMQVILFYDIVYVYVCKTTEEKFWRLLAVVFIVRSDSTCHC